MRLASRKPLAEEESSSSHFLSLTRNPPYSGRGLRKNCRIVTGRGISRRPIISSRSPLRPALLLCRSGDASQPLHQRGLLAGADAYLGGGGLGRGGVHGPRFNPGLARVRSAGGRSRECRGAVSRKHPSRLLRAAALNCVCNSGDLKSQAASSSGAWASLRPPPAACRLYA